MKEIFCSLLALLGLASCQGDETLAGYVAPDAVYQLVRLNEAPFAARATIRFLPGGEVTGQAPCNSFGAVQTAPYPWFELGPIRATRATCPSQKHETEFLTILGRMELAEVSGDLVLLSNEAGETLEFQRAP